MTVANGGPPGSVRAQVVRFGGWFGYAAGLSQRALQARAVQITTDIAQTRLLLFAQQDNVIPLPFLVILVFWLTILFFSFALFAEPTPMVIGALLVFAISATGAIYLILELSQPFDGMLMISSDPLRHALVPLDR